MDKKTDKPKRIKRPRDQGKINKMLNGLPGSSRVACKPIEYKINPIKEEDWEGLDERLAEQQEKIDKKYPGKTYRGPA